MKAICALFVPGLMLTSLLLACQPPNSEGPLPTAMASASNSGMSSVQLSIMEAVRSPNQRKMALWQGIDERITPFNQYQGVQISIVESQAPGQAKTKALPTLRVQKDYEILDDQIWWIDDQTLLFTASDAQGQVIYSLDTQTMNESLFYRFPQRANKLVPSLNKLHFLAGKSLEMLDLSSKKQSSVINFNADPLLLYPTYEPELWVVGIGQSIVNFALQRTPPESVDYYVVHTQKKTMQICQHPSVTNGSVALALNSQNPYQETVVCPQMGQSK